MSLRAPRTTGELHLHPSDEFPASRVIPHGATCVRACAEIPTSALEADVVIELLQQLNTLRVVLVDTELSVGAVHALSYLRDEISSTLGWRAEQTERDDPAREAICRQVCEPFTRLDLDLGLISKLLHLGRWASQVLQAWSGTPVPPRQAKKLRAGLDTFYRTTFAEPARSTGG